MKKLLCLLFLIFFLVSCSQADPIIEDKYQGVVTMEFDLSYMTLRNFEVDEELAMSIGKMVLTKRYSDWKKDNTYFIVCELAGQDIFIVTMLHGPPDAFAGDYNVAIDKKDGRVLGFFQGE